MAVLRLARYRITRDVYDEVAVSMRLHTEHPLGLIMHGVSEVDGELQVAQVWDRADYARATSGRSSRPRSRHTA